MMRLSLLAMGAAVAAYPALAQDMSPAEEAHALRLAHMGLYAANLGPLVGMARGEVEYDAEVAATRAGNIAAYASADLRPYLVEGSSSADLEDSRALPVIWENMEDFAAQQTNLAEAAEAVVAASGEGQEAFAAAFRELGSACGSCHEDYRQPED